MNDRNMSQETMLSSLHGIELPAQAAGGLVSDVALTLGLACLAALGVAAVLRLFSLQQPRHKEDLRLQDQLAATQALPETERRLLYLHWLRDHAPERYREVARDLYRPDAALRAAEVEAELKRLV